MGLSGKRASCILMDGGQDQTRLRKETREDAGLTGPVIHGL